MTYRSVCNEQVVLRVMLFFERYPYCHELTARKDFKNSLEKHGVVISIVISNRVNNVEMRVNLRQSGVTMYMMA